MVGKESLVETFLSDASQGQNKKKLPNSEENF